tara:strand:+ start:9133 stop:9504 length:372 start_codon:yes stop_codon:yes gene_type:complete
MLFETSVEITTDSGGDATVYLGSNLRGFVMSIRYEPGTLATGADLTITGENSGVPILTVTNGGTSNVAYYPRALVNQVADAAAASTGTELIPLVDDRVKVVVAQGGNAVTGTITLVYMTRSPY